MYKLLHELPNVFITTFETRKLGNFKKFPEMLGFHGEYPTGHPEDKFWRFSVKKMQKISCKT